MRFKFEAGSMGWNGVGGKLPVPRGVTAPSDRVRIAASGLCAVVIAACHGDCLTNKIASISTDIALGKEPMPIADRACLPAQRWGT
jgi:hypothetical protein